MFIIMLGHGYSVGIVFSSFERAEEAALQMNLRNYEIIEDKDVVV